METMEETWLQHHRLPWPSGPSKPSFAVLDIGDFAFISLSYISRTTWQLQLAGAGKFPESISSTSAVPLTARSSFLALAGDAAAPLQRLRCD